jgi:arginine/lysine/ornithine decarboxylase
LENGLGSGLEDGLENGTGSGLGSGLENDRFDGTPLLAALAGRTGSDRLGFHMPGHQKGKGMWEPFERLLRQAGPDMDLTELPGLDHLTAPEGCLREAQEHMARLYGTDATFFLINGASVGLMAAVLAMNAPGKTLWLPADAHISLHHALVLSGGKPAYAPVRTDPVWGVSLGADADAWERVLCEYTDGDLAVAVHPNYHGVGAPLEQLAALLKERPGAAWLVDEAHGAHLPFTGAGPKSAAAYLPDALVHGTHKTMGSMTQTALLHCMNPVWFERLRESLRLLQSSSPSYVLMASLEAMGGYIETHGRQRFREMAALAAETARGIRAIGGYRLFRDETDAGETDPCRITFSAADLGLSGHDLAGILRERYKIDVEMDTDFYVLCMLTVGHDAGDVERLLSALRQIAGERVKLASAGLAPAKFAPAKAVSPVLRETVVAVERTPREVFFCEREAVCLEQAQGRLAAGIVAVYPPGVPLIFPGQRLKDDDTRRIAEIRDMGGALTGLLSGGRIQVCGEG